MATTTLPRRTVRARRRPRSVDWEAFGVLLFSALCGGLGVGIVGFRG